MFTRTPHNHGYSLIETVIYVSIVGAMIILGGASILSVYRTFGVLRVDRKIALNGDAAMEIMIRDIRSATSTNLNTSIFHTSPGVLRLNAKKYSLNGTALNRVDGANSAQDITASDVSISNLTFYATSSSVSEIVSVRMTVTSGQGLFSRSKQYFGSAVLRGSYR